MCCAQDQLSYSGVKKVPHLYHAGTCLPHHPLPQTPCTPLRTSPRTYSISVCTYLSTVACTSTYLPTFRPSPTFPTHQPHATQPTTRLNPPPLSLSLPPLTKLSSLSLPLLLSHTSFLSFPSPPLINKNIIIITHPSSSLPLIIILTALLYFAYHPRILYYTPQTDKYSRSRTRP